jgi:hypothetical protein
VQGRQVLQGRGAFAGQLQPDHPPVVRVGHPLDEAERAHPLGELNGAVMPEQKVPGHVTDRRPAGILMPPDSQQKLVMRRRQADRLRLLLAPVQVLAQARTESQQLLVVRVLQLKSHHDTTLLQRALR